MRHGRPSRTAEHNALFRALEAQRPFADRMSDDGFARRFLTGSLRVVAEAARIAAVRRLIELVIDVKWPGPRPGMIVRTRLLDDAIAAELRNVEQVVILGAGLDSRAYRLAASVRTFEVDHPTTQERKRRLVRRVFGEEPANVAFVAVDFGRDDLVTSLEHAGIAIGARTLVLWEGVTNYLTADAVDETLCAIAKLLMSGSLLFFTYIDRRMLDGSVTFDGAAASANHVRRVGEPYIFGLEPACVDSYLNARGFALEWDTDVAAASARYGEPINGYAYYHVALARRHDDAAR